MNQDDRKRLEAEFAMLLSRAGVDVPHERRPAVFVGFLKMQERIKLLHAFIPEHCEPMPVFMPLGKRRPVQ